MYKLFFGLILSLTSASSIAQENIYDILGMDMVDTSDYDGKIMFYEEMPYNLLNKSEVDKKIDHDIEHAQKQHFKTLGEVNSYLVKNKTTEYQKVRAFFRWIVKNIEFDIHSYENSHFPPQHPLVVYQGRKGLSQGFSDLLTIFCQNNDIECRSLKGYTKGFDLEHEKREYPNHYWNVVRLDGYWYLIDIPMCLGRIENKKFVRDYKEDFFLPPPTEFAKSHLPIHSSWQLLENRVALEDFFK